MAEQAQPTNQQLIGRAKSLYHEAVKETPPNRIKLDNLLDLLRAQPFILYAGMFDTAIEAAGAIVDSCPGGEKNEDDSLLILTPPAIWGWMAVEESVCRVPPNEWFDTTYPTYVVRFLELANRTLKYIESTPGQIVRRAVQALTRFWPELIHLCLKVDPNNLTWKQVYMNMRDIGADIHKLSTTSDDPILQVHLVKFEEIEATMFSEEPEMGPDHARGFIHINMIPTNHPYMDQSLLGSRGSAARQQLIQLLPDSDNLGLCNMTFVTALINSLVYLMNLRPQGCNIIVDRLMEWYGIINSSGTAMTNTQLAMIGKTLRISLLQLYTRPHMGVYSEILENILDSIGGAEWAALQDRLKREREKWERQKKARERSQMNKLMQQTHHSARWMPANAEDEENMADQPAPGADIRTHKPSAVSGEKRSASSRLKRQEDEEEENQSRMLEENAKRVKLDEVSMMVGEGANSQLLTSLSPGTETDRELEEQLKQSLPKSAFELPDMGEVSFDKRRELMTDAIKRVVEASSAVNKFIARNRLSTQSTINAAGAKTVLDNGLSTNAGVVEDAKLLLVRMISNCFTMSSDIIMFDDLEANDEDKMEVDDKPKEEAVDDSMWGELRKCTEGVLQSIIEKPRENYEVAILMLYELWMAVVISNPNISESENESEDVLMKDDSNISSASKAASAMYQHWCDSILHAMIRCSIEATRGQKPAQVVPEQNEATGEQQQQQQQQQVDTTDRLILDFVLEVPYILPKTISRIEVCLKSTETAALGYTTLDKVIASRPPVFKEGLKILLTYSCHSDQVTRIGCIKAVKKYYMASTESGLIEKGARASLRLGMENAKKKGEEMEAKIDHILNAPPAETEIKEDSDAMQISEEALERRKADIVKARVEGEKEIESSFVQPSELLLALCTRNMNLYLDVLKAYAESSQSVQAAIRRTVTPMLKAIANTPSKIIPVLSQLPPKSETLALRTIFVLSVEGPAIPSRDLVQAVIDLCDSGKLDGRALVFVTNGMTRDEVLARMGLFVKLYGLDAQKQLLKECFTRLTTSYMNRPSVLSPTELLMALNEVAKNDTSLPMDHLIGAVVTYESMKKPDDTPLFPTQVFSTVLKLLNETLQRQSSVSTSKDDGHHHRHRKSKKKVMEDVSPLTLVIAEVYHMARQGPPGLIISMMGKLIEGRVWEMNERVFISFVRCFYGLQPGSLGLIKSIPPDALKRIVTTKPELGPIVRDYVNKMPDSFKSKHKWLF